MNLEVKLLPERIGSIDLSLLGPRLTAKEMENLSIFDLLGYIGVTDLHPGGEKVTRELLQLANPQPGQRVLEIGCGCGATSARLAAIGCNVIALDRSHFMLEACARTPTTNGHVCVLYGDITERLEISDGSIDLVVCEGVLGFVKDRSLALKQARRIVRPDGFFMSIEFYYTNYPSDRAVQYMTEALRLNKPMLLSDWYELFKNTCWQIVDEKTFRLSDTTIHNENDLAEVAEEIENVFNYDNRAAELLRKRFEQYEAAASYNRQHLAFAARLLKPI